MAGNLKNEDLFKEMFNVTQEGILVVNEHGIIIMANPACKNLFNYNSDALLGKNINILVTEKYKEGLKKKLFNLKKTTFSKPLVVMGLKKDSTSFDLEIRLNYTKISDNNAAIVFLRGVSNTTENLSKIKHANKALFESNRKYDVLINNLQGIVYRCKNDRDWTMEYISDGCQKITGYSAKAFLDGTVHFSQIIFQEDLDQLWDETQKGLLNKKHFCLNFRIKDNQDNVKYLHEIDQGIYDKDGILEAIEGFEKMTGYTKNDVLGKDFKILQCHKEDQKKMNLLNDAIHKGETGTAVLRTYRKDGTVFWNNVTVTPIYNSDNTLTHFVGVLNDVTKDVEEERLKSQIQKILELIAQDKPLYNTTKEIIDTAETYIKGCVGSISLLNNLDKTLSVLNAPNLPKAFYDYINGTVIGPKVGSCGTAAFLKKEVVVSNIATSLYWEDHKNEALKYGIKACWAFPIMSSTNKVLGTLAIYSFLVRQPLPREKEILLDMTYLASIAIEKHHNRIVLEESKKQLKLYAQRLEEKVQERTQEVMATVKELVATNLNLEDQILITKQAERDAITSKALTTAIAKNFPKGFIAVMNRDMQLILAEGEALEELGLRPHLFEGMTIDDISVFAEKRKKRIKEDISKTLLGKRFSFEIEYKNRYFAVNTAPLFNENNQIISALMVYNDISEQKQIEFNIQKALKKERELNELKSRFISMASHMFRTPLSVILTSAVLISKQNGPKQEFKRERYILQIEKNVNHLVTILNDFLSLSKLEEGKIVAVKKRFDIVHFSKKAINDIKLSLKKGQHIRFRSPMEKLFVNLDSKLLRHIIDNLLSNASKYSEDNTTIDFEIAEQNNLVFIQITDQGMGIPEEEQERLFSRFYRAKNAINIEGTGLGLNIAKHYTELMGGTIGFISNLNVGTTFWVELPM